MQISLSIILIFIVTCCSLAQSETGGVEGTIVDSVGKPLPKAQVILESTKTIGNNSGFHRTVESDSKGFISIPDVPPGSYTVTARADKFSKPFIQNIFIDAGDRANADFAIDSARGTEPVYITVSGPGVCSNEIIIFIAAEKSLVIDAKQKIPVFVDGEKVALISPSALFKLTIEHGKHRISFDKLNITGSLEADFRVCRDH